MIWYSNRLQPILANKARLLMIVPFGRPVVPLVYRITNGASAETHPPWAVRGFSRGEQPVVLGSQMTLVLHLKRFRDRRKLLAADEQPGSRVVDDVLQFGRGQPAIQRQQDEPGAYGRDMDLEILRFILRQQGDDIAGFQGPVAE